MAACFTKKLCMIIFAYYLYKRGKRSGLLYSASRCDNDQAADVSLQKENIYVSHYCKKTGMPYPLLLSGSYKTAAEHFNVIDQVTTSALVPYGKRERDYRTIE